MSGGAISIPMRESLEHSPPILLRSCTASEDRHQTRRSLSVGGSGHRFGAENATNLKSREHVPIQWEHAPRSDKTSSMQPAYLDNLNESQRAAVEATEGPVLVLAGAGTGKTRVLTTRLAHILMSGRARPGELLAVTFTNKAAREMKERISKLLGRPVEGWWLGTFHALAARILRRHAEVVGLKPNFTILDTDDQVRLLKQLAAAEDIDEKRWPARAL